MEVRPTYFTAVPRVWEKLAEAVKGKLSQVTGIKKMIGNRANNVGIQYYRNAERGYEQKNRL